MPAHSERKHKPQPERTSADLQTIIATIEHHRQEGLRALELARPHLAKVVESRKRIRRLEAAARRAEEQEA